MGHFGGGLEKYLKKTGVAEMFKKHKSEKSQLLSDSADGQIWIYNFSAQTR